MVQQAGGKRQMARCRHVYQPGGMKCGQCGKHISHSAWLRKVVQGIRDSYPDGQPLSRGDRALIVTLLKRHPEAEAKIAAGVQDIFVHSYVGKGRCFWVVRRDGSLTHFSYHRAVYGREGHEPNAKTLAAMATFDERRALRAYRAARRARRTQGRAA